MWAEYATDPRDEAQPRHPPPARAAARQRPRRDRADDGDPLLAARQPGPLLRRRDRDGRQHLPRRPRRRPHADAVDGRPQRRLLARRLRAALPAAADGPGLRLPGGQRRGAAAHADVAAALAAPLHRAAQGASRLRARHATRRCARRTRASSRTSAATRTRSCSASTTSSRSAQAGRARPVALRGARARRRCSAARASRAIGELPYLLTLAGRGFFWFQLVRGATDEPSRRRSTLVPESALVDVHPRASAGSARSRARSPASRIVDSAAAARRRRRGSSTRSSRCATARGRTTSTSWSSASRRTSRPDRRSPNRATRTSTRRSPTRRSPARSST